MEKFVVFSILLRTRMVPSEVSFIIILFSVIYASLLFAVHFVVTFEKQANISVVESGYSRSYFNLFLIHAVMCDARKYKPSQIYKQCKADSSKDRLVTKILS